MPIVYRSRSNGTYQVAYLKYLAAKEAAANAAKTQQNTGK